LIEDDVESDGFSIFKKESDSMFDQLFFRSDALTRQLSAPLVDERRQYLARRAAQGMSKCTLRMKARLLLSIADYLRLAEQPSDTIALPEIKRAASRWSSHNWPLPESSHAKRSREYFMAQAAGWLTFLNRLQTPPKPITVYDRMLAEQELEGIVGKRRDCLYEPGRRSGAWIKHRVNRGQEFVVGGYFPGAHGFDSLIVGYYDAGKLMYVARTRNGFVPASRVHVVSKLKPLVTATCPFANLPDQRKSRFGEELNAEKMKKAVWLKPEVVVEIEFLEWNGGRPTSSFYVCQAS